MTHINNVWIADGKNELDLRGAIGIKAATARELIEILQGLGYIVKEPLSRSEARRIAIQLEKKLEKK